MAEVNRAAGMLEGTTSAKIANLGIVCAFLVLVLHWGAPQNLGTFSWYCSQFCQGVANIAVPCFFAISGFLLSRHVNEDQWWRRAVLKRVRTLLLPFFIWNVFTFLFAVSMSLVGDLAYHREIGSVLPSILLEWNHIVMRILGVDIFVTPYSSILWYVRCLFLFVLVTPIFVLLLRSRCIGGFVLVVLFACAYFLDINWNWGEVPSRSIMYLIKPKSIFYFPLGVFLGMHPIRLRHGLLLGWLSLFVGIGMVSVHVYFISHDGNFPIKFYFLSVPFLCFAFWELMSGRAWPKFITSCSFPVYLMQGIGGGFAAACRLTNAESIVVLAGRAILAFVVACGLSWFMRKRVPRVAAVVFGGR